MGLIKVGQRWRRKNNALDVILEITKVMLDKQEFICVQVIYNQNWKIGTMTSYTIDQCDSDWTYLVGQDKSV
jgi:hypothetical protein